MSRERSAPIVRFLVLSALVAIVAGCSSQRRLFLGSPFQEGQPDPQRVNLWPAYYQDRGRQSVLWPLFDVDEKGFALRPLVAKDGHDLDVLWPLSHFDLESGDFWFLTAYREEGNVGLFPAFGFGRLDYVGPFWRHQDTDGETESWGFFPLAYFDADDEVRYVFPYLHTEDRDANGASDNHVDALLVPPMAYWSDESEQRSGSFVFPIWWDFERGADGWNSLFPLWYWSKDKDERMVLTPLGGYGEDASGKLTFVNILGPVFHTSASANDHLTAVAWPLFVIEREGDATSWRAFPLVGGTLKEGERHQWLFATLWRWDETKKASAVRLWPLFATSTDELGGWSDQVLDALTPIGWFPHEEKSHFHLGTCALLSFDLKGKERDSWNLRLLTLLQMGHNQYMTEEQAAAALAKSPGHDIALSRDYRGGLFDWALSERRDYLAADGSKRTDAHYRVPLLYEYERDARETQWDTLLWLIHSDQTSEEDRFYFLWHLYRRVTRGERTSRDFPLVTYDTAPDATTFSFLWRFFRYERRGEKVGGHVLFIPWGDDVEAKAADSPP